MVLHTNKWVQEQSTRKDKTLEISFEAEKHSCDDVSSLSSQPAQFNIFSFGKMKITTD